MSLAQNPTPKHVHTQLLGAVRKQLASDAMLAGLLLADEHQPPRLSVSLLETRPWASATFNGAHHHLEMALHNDGPLQQSAPATDRIISALHDADLMLNGYALIDFQFAGAETKLDDGGSSCRLHFDALTLSDDVG